MYINKKFQKKQTLIPGDVVYEVNVNNNILKWTVKDCNEYRHQANYVLINESGDSFCTYDGSAIGRDIFLDYDEAKKEKERRIL